MKRVFVFTFSLLLLAQSARAQGLNDLINQLFIFGQGEDALFLAGTSDPNNPTAVQAHGAHFIPSAVDNNATLILFLQSAIGANIANLPISSTSSGRTFRFVGGVPVATSTSPGPIFAERAQTLGRGRVLVGANVNFFRFSAVRGVQLDNIGLNFTHVNADFPGCDTVFGGDCTDYGLPGLENDFIHMDLTLDLDVTSTVFVVTYGLFDWMDIGAAVPIVSTNLSGTSVAQVVPFGGTTATHFFDGTPGSPNLFATRTVSGSASGLGDLATRLKIRLVQSSTSAFAILADARFPTGSVDDFLGAGSTSIRGLGIISAQFGDFSPHANVGYVYRDKSVINDAVLATLGFDHMLADWVTIAVDLITELQAGETQLTVPDPVTVDVPFRRIIESTNIPNTRDDIINGSFGFKFVTGSGLTILANAMVPLNAGGLRPKVGWTMGLEYNF